MSKKLTSPFPKVGAFHPCWSQTLVTLYQYTGLTRLQSLRDFFWPLLVDHVENS